MNINQIKAAVDAGVPVYWDNDSYRVIKDSAGQYLIQCVNNGHCIGLHGQEGTKYENVLNGKESDFHTPELTIKRRVGRWGIIHYYIQGVPIVTFDTESQAREFLNNFK